MILFLVPVTPNRGGIFHVRPRTDLLLSALISCHMRIIRDYGGFKVPLYFVSAPFIVAFIIRKAL